MKHKHNPILLNLCIALGLFGSLSLPAAHAHVFYYDIPLKHGKAKTVVPYGSQKQNTWVLGTRPLLVNVMGGMGDMKYYRLHLDSNALVNLDLTPAPLATGDENPKKRQTWTGPAKADIGFTLYQGTLPLESMDYYGPTARPELVNTVYDSAQYFLDSSAHQYFNARSERDKAPNDPNIPVTVDDLDDSGQLKNSAIGEYYGLTDPISIPARKLNPDWQRSFADLAADPNLNAGYDHDAILALAQAASTAGSTPEAWYAATYLPHNGYRDTLNLTTAGGICLPGEPGADDPLAASPCVVGAGKYVITSGFQGYFGQVDTLGDWSIADGSANNVFDATYMSEHPDYDPATMETSSCTQFTDASQPGFCAQPNYPGTDWSKIYYVGHSNRYDSDGIDPATQFGRENSTPERLHNLYLPQGDYTLLAGGGCSECVDRTQMEPVDYVGGQPGDGYKGGIQVNVQTWPVEDCTRSGASAAAPQMTAVSGPWDVEAGQALDIPLGAHYCGSDVLSFQIVGIDGATVATPAPFKLNKPPATATHHWTSSAHWTAPADQAGKLITAKVKTLVNGVAKGKTQKLRIRVWPTGANPSNSYAIQNLKAKIIPANFQLVITGKVQVTNTKLLLPEEKLMLTSGVVAPQNINSTAFMPAANGKIATSVPLDSSAVPCKVVWKYRDLSGEVPVENAPSNCVP